MFAGGDAPVGGYAAVSRADLEASPSWQLQRRLRSLEARAAALLLDEEGEGLDDLEALEEHAA